VRDVEEKNGKGNAQILNLFHGTRLADPKAIYESEEGFNINYSKDGCLWGKALYFAFNSSYSNEYAHLKNNGQR
jgi:hypothetical protein